MMKPGILILTLICMCFFSVAQKTDKKLEKKLLPLLEDFHGEVGIYVKNIKTGKTVTFHADSIFPTASMIKVPILVGIMDKIKRGELNYHTPLLYKDSLLYAGVDILGSFKDSETVELGKVMMLMLTMSDNTASLWLQSLAGTGTRINAIMDSLGLAYTRVNSRTPGREQQRSEYGWGQTTPREMATLLEKIYKGELVSPGASLQMQRSLGRNFWDNVSLSQIPPYAQVISKNGAVDQSRSEAVLVTGKRAQYVFCICTKNNKDSSWSSTNEAWQMTRRVSALLWNYFEPRDHWRPPADADQFN